MRRLLEIIAQGRARDRKSHPGPRRIRNEAETGLKIIYKGTDCSVDIVAIHGDGGHYIDSWTHPDGQIFWLRDLLPGIIPQSRVLSFGYSASKSEFVPAEEICRGLLKGISEARQRPIIFLAHSFGVLLLKAVRRSLQTLLKHVPANTDAQTLAMSSSEFNSIIPSTRGIIFFGSPPNIGHSLQTLMSSFPLTTDVMSEPAAGLTAMKEDLTWLQDAESRYNELEKKGEFEVTYFLESSGERHEAPEAEQKKYTRMRKSHGMMIRFSGADDENFYLVKERIQQMVTNENLA
uniref:Protein SERAC1 n=1 Tax=Talaromyces marneffei PM1 TaxID=1077442 RepID=A0A093V994_TALMA